MARPERAEMIIRLPLDIKRWVEQQANHYGTSQNAQVVSRLRRDMDAAETHTRTSSAA